MKKIAMLVMALFAFVSVATAAEPAADTAKNKELAEKLMNTLKISEMMTRSLDMMKKMQLNMMAKRLKGQELQNMEELNRSMMDLAAKELNWEKLKDPFINIYAESFTAEELEAMIKFYESPVGKKLVEKQPEMQQKTMQLMQTIMMKLMPEFDKLAKDFAEKHKKAAPAPEAAGTPDEKSASPAAATPAEKPAPAPAQ